MKEDTKDWIGAILIIALVLGAGTFLMVNVSLSTRTYYEVVDSEISNTQIIQDDEGKIEYIEITFANGESYKVESNNDIDLTVNSRMIIEFGNLGRRNWFWEDFEPEDDIYFINQILYQFGTFL